LKNQETVLKDLLKKLQRVAVTEDSKALKKHTDSAATALKDTGLG